MSYILKLAGWYPSKIDAFSGDFVQRHAKSIALYEKTIVIYITKSNIHSSITIEKKEANNLTEYIGYYPQAKLVGKILSQYNYFKVFKKIIKEIFNQHGKPKLVHVNIVWKAGLLALYLRNNFGLPYVITENWTGYYKEDKDYIAKLKLRFKLHKKVFANASYFLPVTKDLALICNTLFNLNLPFIVVENAVDTSLFYPQEKKESEIKLLHISTMGYQKNTDNLLDVLEEVIENANETCKLTLIGSYTPKVIELVEDSTPLGANTVITGNISYTEVANHLRGASILVLFSRYENLPCVILESLCCGVPVISTDVGGIREVIHKDNGILVPSEDKEALKEALKKVISEIHYYNKEQIAKEAIQLFSYEAIGLKYKNAYEFILNDIKKAHNLKS